MTEPASPGQASEAEPGLEDQRLADQAAIIRLASGLAKVAGVLEDLSFVIGLAAFVTGLILLSWVSPAYYPSGQGGSLNTHPYQAIGVAVVLSAPIDGLIWFTLARICRLFAQSQLFQARTSTFPGEPPAST